MTNKDVTPVTKKRTKHLYDEIVLAVDPQVIVVFMISLDYTCIAALLKDFNREISTNERDRKIDKSNRKDMGEGMRTVGINSDEEEEMRTVGVVPKVDNSDEEEMRTVGVVPKVDSSSSSEEEEPGEQKNSGEPFGE